jgi:hypothetical protein
MELVVQKSSTAQLKRFIRIKKYFEAVSTRFEGEILPLRCACECLTRRMQKVFRIFCTFLGIPARHLLWRIRHLDPTSTRPSRQPLEEVQKEGPESGSGSGDSDDFAVRSTGKCRVAQPAGQLPLVRITVVGFSQVFFTLNMSYLCQASHQEPIL